MQSWLFNKQLSKISMGCLLIVNASIFGMEDAPKGGLQSALKKLDIHSLTGKQSRVQTTPLSVVPQPTPTPVVNGEIVIKPSEEFLNVFEQLLATQSAWAEVALEREHSEQLRLEAEKNGGSVQQPPQVNVSVEAPNVSVVKDDKYYKARHELELAKEHELGRFLAAIKSMEHEFYEGYVEKENELALERLKEADHLARKRDKEVEERKGDRQRKLQRDRLEHEKKLHAEKLKHDVVMAPITHKQMLEKMRLFGSGVYQFLGDKDRLMMTAGALSLAALGIYGAKRGTRVGFNYVESLLMQPSIVSETSRLSLNRFMRQPIVVVKEAFTKKQSIPAPIYQPKLDERLAEYTLSTKHIKEFGGNMRHAMFYGAPGTGKTLKGRELAQKLDFNFALIPASNISQLSKEQALQEVKKLFEWAMHGRCPTLLFFDEVDVLAPNRTGNIAMSEETRLILNAVLAYTGTETKKFLLVCTTNHPENLDPAFLNRMDELIEFPLPEVQQRVDLIKLFLNEYFVKDAKSNIQNTGLINDKIAEVAQKTEGFSGRQLSQLVNALRAKAFAAESRTLTREMVDQVVGQRVRDHAAMLEKRSASTQTRPS